MATHGLEVVILAIILGTLFAIVYSLRVLVLMERRIARIDMHIESLVTRVLAEENKIEQEEIKIETLLNEVKGLKKAVKKPATKKKTTKKKTVKKKRK
ncbi:hypothetical protein KO361_03850 [Candidatus Woesearchaeota archaeon]|nr:hypothetical protein [Candidatus Woesearchaeota archaeon]